MTHFEKDYSGDRNCIIVFWKVTVALSQDRNPSSDEPHETPDRPVTTVHGCLLAHALPPPLFAREASVMAHEAGIHELATSLVWVNAASLGSGLQKHEWLLALRDGEDAKGRLKVKFYGNGLPCDGERAGKIPEKHTLFVDSSQLDAEQSDVALMNSFSAAPLVHVTRSRFREGKIHTRVGDIVIVINPYTNVVNSTYPHGIDYPLFGGGPLDKTLRSQFSRSEEPHVFSIAEAALREMFSGQLNAKSGTRDQSCMVSGESGAGKTEACKRIMKYLAAVVEIERAQERRASGLPALSLKGKRAKVSDLSMEDKILKCNPFLEAFGNAKTTRNDNSSRFGKFVKIQYNARGAIVGSRIEQYLLEKARLAHQGPNERCFHIFYFMLAGMPSADKKKLHLEARPELYPMVRCDAKRRGARVETHLLILLLLLLLLLLLFPLSLQLNFGRETTIDTIDEVEEWGLVQESLQVAGIGAAQQQAMWKMLAGILQLSAIEWVDEHSATGDAVAVVANPMVSQQATENLGLGALPTLHGDVKTALNMIPAGRAKSMSAMKLDAKAARNQTLALVKDIYHHLFMWTVAQVSAASTRIVPTSSSCICFACFVHSIKFWLLIIEIACLSPRTCGINTYRSI